MVTGLRWIERAREIVRETLWFDWEPEVERTLVEGAVVIRDGEHYRIESGDESWEELEALARVSEGVCDCGSPLSDRGHARCCRSCGREYARR